MVLLCGELIAAAAGPVGYFLTMTGGQMVATRIEAIASAIAVALALVLIPRYGILGAAIAVAVGSVVRHAWMFVAVWRRLGLRSAPF
jgi:O-antigen/teichoic acid export membrane protein